MNTASPLTPRINDEEPTAIDFDRLWAALDATLDPEPPPAGERGRCACKRCGWRWDPRHQNPHPRMCPGCHSQYWDREPVNAYAAHASPERLALMQQGRERAKRERKLNYHRREAEKLAAELGLMPRPPRRKGQRSAKPKTRITEPAEPPTVPRVELRDPQPPAPPTWPQAAYHRPTVPPPPGLEDVAGEKR
jgi:hypothetical protein